MFGIMGPGLAAARLEEKKRREAARGSNRKRRGRSMMAIFGIFPLLTIPVVIYNLMAFVFPGKATIDPATGEAVAPAIVSSLQSSMLTLPMVSGATWTMTVGDLLILVSLVFLFVEILKSTSTGTATIMNHAVSMVLFIVCLVEFLLFGNFATSVFFILTMMALLDVLAGVVVTIVSARRDFAVGEGFSG
tara:strand:- start:12488 stop:13057 length:570 start_codon:yes stop_codon:yes gene_type:complete